MNNHLRYHQTIIPYVRDVLSSFRFLDGYMYGPAELERHTANEILNVFSLRTYFADSLMCSLRFQSRDNVEQACELLNDALSDPVPGEPFAFAVWKLILALAVSMGGAPIGALRVVNAHDEIRLHFSYDGIENTLCLCKYKVEEWAAPETVQGYLHALPYDSKRCMRLAILHVSGHDVLEYAGDLTDDVMKDVNYVFEQLRIHTMVTPRKETQLLAYTDLCEQNSLVDDPSDAGASMYNYSVHSGQMNIAMMMASVRNDPTLLSAKVVCRDEFIPPLTCDTGATLKDFVQGVDSAFNTFQQPLPQDIEIYRCSSYLVLNDAGALDRETPFAIENTSFVSTSIEEAIADEFAVENGVKLRLTIPGGFGSALALHRSMYPEQREILLHPGCQFIITGSSFEDVVNKSGSKLRQLVLQGYVVEVSSVAGGAMVASANRTTIPVGSINRTIPTRYATGARRVDMSRVQRGNVDIESFASNAAIADGRIHDLEASATESRPTRIFDMGNGISPSEAFEVVYALATGNMDAFTKNVHGGASGTSAYCRALGNIALILATLAASTLPR